MHFLFFFYFYFLQEVSYLPVVDRLPGPDSVRDEELLLTVWLWSCGRVPTDESSGGRHSTAPRAAAFYHALVTWLLSLVSTCSDSAQQKLLCDKGGAFPSSEKVLEVTCFQQLQNSSAKGR